MQFADILKRARVFYLNLILPLSFFSILCILWLVITIPQLTLARLFLQPSVELLCDNYL